MDIKKFLKLKDQTEELRTKIAEAEGGKKQVLDLICEEFGVNSIKEAEKLKKALEKKEADEEAAFEKALVEFQKEWSRVVTDDDGEY